ncbi:MAG: polysaccharide biosynthesis tyrosine autokinase [Terricaulis sp.]
MRDLWLMLYRRRELVLGVFLVVAALIIGASVLQPRMYTATTTIMINPRTERVLTEQQALTEGSPSAAVVDSEIEVLRSPQLAERLVAALQLDQDPNWNSALRPKSGLAQWIDGIKASLRPGGAAPADPAQVRRDIAGAVAGSIAVRRHGLSYVIDVSVTTRDPAESARVANGLIDAYLQFSNEARIETGQRASTWLVQRLEELRTDVQQKEAAAQTYRARTGLLTSGGVSLTETQIGEVQGAVLAARADLAEREARYRQVQTLVATGGSADSIGGVLNSDVVRDLRSRESELERRQAEYENTLGERHPSVLNGRAEIENVRTQIAAEITRIQANLSNEVDVARSRLRTLEQSLGAVRGDLVGNNTLVVQLNELEREAAAARVVYESFLQRAHEVSEQGSLETSDVRIVSNARPPTGPSAPNLVLGLVLALVGGAAAGVGIALVAETMDDGIKSPEEVERKLGVPTVASIPVIRSKALRLLAPGDRHPGGYAVEKQMSAYTEAFRVLQTAIKYADPDEKHGVIALTSTAAGEGKTTCALSLARVAALSGERVLLIDCDLRRHSLNEVLGIAPERGLLQVLSGEVDWRDVVGRDEPTGAHILPVAAAQFSPRNVFASDAMHRLIAETRQAYDVIILDCAPVLAVAQTRVVATHADAVILVAAWNKTPARAIATALEQLSSTGAKILGVAINRVDPRSPGSGAYGDPIYYERMGGGYYAS